VLITRISQFTGVERTLDLPITQEQLDAWQGGMVIQRAMPHLSKADREFLITGTTQEEWDKYLGSEDDDDC
jgi:hypothetical protein